MPTNDKLMNVNWNTSAYLAVFHTNDCERVSGWDVPPLFERSHLDPWPQARAPTPATWRRWGTWSGRRARTDACASTPSGGASGTTAPCRASWRSSTWWWTANPSTPVCTRMSATKPARWRVHFRAFSGRFWSKVTYNGQRTRSHTQTAEQTTQRRPPARKEQSGWGALLGHTSTLGGAV